MKIITSALPKDPQTFAIPKAPVSSSLNPSAHLRLGGGLRLRTLQGLLLGPAPHLGPSPVFIAGISQVIWGYNGIWNMDEYGIWN